MELKSSYTSPRSSLFIVGLLLIATVVLATISSTAQPVSQHLSTPTIPARKIQVAAVGDSITYGYGAPESSRDKDSYPAKLQALLGSQYEVHNYGLSGATLLSSGNLPYQSESLYELSRRTNPDVVLIMLGTNDSKASNWNAEKYALELTQFVQAYQNLATKPKVYLITPPAAHANTDIRGDIIAAEVAPIIRRDAKQLRAQLIDVFAATRDHPELFTDGIHPNAAGYHVIAETVYKSM